MTVHNKGQNVYLTSQGPLEGGATLDLPEKEALNLIESYGRHIVDAAKFVAPAIAHEAGKLKEQVQELIEKVDGSKGVIDELKAQLEAAQKENGDLKTQLEASKKEVLDLTKKVNK